MLLKFVKTRILQLFLSLLSSNLQLYASILYLRIHETFQIILCGRVVEHHNVVDDLKFREYIAYKPTVGANGEVGMKCLLPHDL